MSRKVESRSTGSVDGDTRRNIMRALLTDGPITAGDLGEKLGLSAAGVRRHLDILIDEGLAQAQVPKPRRGMRSRGRPAKVFTLTDSGRDHFGHSYDNVAMLALAALKESGGREAVLQLARDRMKRIIHDVGHAEDNADSVAETAEELAHAFDEHGYAATVKKAPGGVQICQHHCPVSHLVEDFPELCEAEHEVIAELTGLHVQPLASIADGHGVCTTNIPINPKF